MPFLRAVGPPGTGVDAEIRSAKTLIGNNPSKCDVVVPASLGVLDLHALLSLSNDQSSATLVPFSASADGACFINGRVVPPEGLMVVHGDRVAFGNAENALVFSLTGNTPSGGLSDARSLQNSRSFRRALDALRGDRIPAVNSSPSQPTATPSHLLATSLGTSQSKEQLDKFLREASTDSLLGDFVERKLRSSSNVASRQLPRERPTAMELPPSLPVSTTSSLHSSLNDSILERTGLPKATTDATLKKSLSFLSTAERNYAEIEKLRLSQRLREVNNVLNGHLGFEASYLSTERRSSGSATMRLSSPLKTKSGQSFLTNDQKGVTSEEEVEEEDEDNDLPAMVEKPKPAKLGKSAKLTPEISTGQSIKSILSSQVNKSVPDSTDNAEDIVPVDESLPSFAEVIMKKSFVETGIASLSVPVSQQGGIDSNPRNRKLRPPLHQQLIDRTLKRKRHEVLAETFIRWRRGLRIQDQRQRDKRRQMQILDKRLQLLRRNQSFSRWKRYSEQKQQVLTCREEAFEQRQHSRRIRNLWMEWVGLTVRIRHRRRALLRWMRSFKMHQLRSGFQRWLFSCQTLRRVTESDQLVQDHQAFIEKRMSNVATMHHQNRVLHALLQRVFRTWRRWTKRTVEKKRVLHRMLVFVFCRKQSRAWSTWKQHTNLHRLKETAEQVRLSDVQYAKDEARKQHEADRLQQGAEHDQRIQELKAKIEEQNSKLQEVEAQARHREQQSADARGAAKALWSTTLRNVLEKAVAQADKQIATLSTQLENLLQRMDLEPEAARFQAASFLVEATLEQKMRHVNELVATQSDLLTAMQCKEPSGAAENTTSWKKTLASDAKYLLEMVQQRHARLHQLYQAIAKLAATTPQRAGGGAQTDTAKLKHAVFLTDAMHERNKGHVDAVVSILHKRCELGAGVREARKY